jgi:PAS domain S-box-containing protein
MAPIHTPIKTISDIKPGDHLCCIYSTEDEHRTVITQYLRAGLEHNEKVFYIVDTRTKEVVIGYLKDDGLDVDYYINKGQFSILTIADAYMKGGVFDPDRMIALLTSETKKALDEGYSALRVTGEMSWALRGLPGSERLIEYENKLNTFFPGSKCLAICQYDRRRFGAEILLNILLTHPFAFIGSNLYDNFYFAPPGEILQPHQSEMTLNRWIVNITERKRVEEALARSENLYRTLAEASPDQIFINGRDGTIHYANSTALKLFQLPYDQVVGKQKNELFPPEIAKIQEASLQTVFETGETLRREEKIQFGTKELWIDIILVPLHDEKGNVTSILGIARDITKRKQAEEALAISNGKLDLLASDLANIINNAPAMIWYKDTNNNFVRVNPAAARAFGLRIEEIEGKSAYDLFPDMAEKYYQDDLEIIHSGNPGFGIIETMQNAAGETLWVQTDKIPLKDEQSMVTGVLVFSVDITERKRVEEALALSSRKLNLLSSITRHDILNQLMVLQGYLEMDLEDTSDPGLRTHIEHEIIAAQTIQRQIEFTKEYQELGMQVPEWQNIHACILQATVHLPMDDIGLSIDLADLELYADRLIGKVFYNLLDNALRYGGEKMTMIRVSSHEDDDSLVILFEDNGAGIPAEDKNKLFTQGFGKNTGLGLFLSREILAITGITITENGEPGEGARFEIRVPKAMYRFGTV